mmetsp:Transcript_133826/g.317185  ORF Transcript_133826/g.317185 Transcript_133826/m.317185 type:complete len:529 (+) Transcript_133826:75-1661(+)
MGQACHKATARKQLLGAANCGIPAGELVPRVADRISGALPPGAGRRRCRRCSRGHVRRRHDAQNGSTCHLRLDGPAAEALVVAVAAAVRNAPGLRCLALHASHHLAVGAIHSLLLLTEPVGDHWLAAHVHHPLQWFAALEAKVVAVLPIALSKAHRHSGWAICRLILRRGPGVPRPAVPRVVRNPAGLLNDGGIHMDAHLDEVHILAIPSGAAHSGGHKLGLLHLRAGACPVRGNELDAAAHVSAANRGHTLSLGGASATGTAAAIVPALQAEDGALWHALLAGAVLGANQLLVGALCPAAIDSHHYILTVAPAVLRGMELGRKPRHLRDICAHAAFLGRRTVQLDFATGGADTNHLRRHLSGLANEVTHICLQLLNSDHLRVQLHVCSVAKPHTPAELAHATHAGDGGGGGICPGRGFVGKVCGPCPAGVLTSGGGGGAGLVSHGVCNGRDLNDGARAHARHHEPRVQSRGHVCSGYRLDSGHHLCRCGSARRCEGDDVRKRGLRQAPARGKAPGTAGDLHGGRVGE